MPTTIATPTALRILRAEHRSIAAVLHGLLHFVDQKLTGEPLPEARVFRAMLQYLDLYAERMHHPKEDLHLFARLRERTHDADAVLDKLQEDHFFGLGAIQSLEQAFMRYEEGGESYFDEFARKAREYAAFYRNHMHTEEDVLFPLAERALSEADWRDIGTAFAAQQIPLATEAEKRDLRKLFTHIVTITPPPIGVGPAARVLEDAQGN